MSVVGKTPTGANVVAADAYYRGTAGETINVAAYMPGDIETVQGPNFGTTVHAPDGTPVTPSATKRVLPKGCVGHMGIQQLVLPTDGLYRVHAEQIGEPTIPSLDALILAVTHDFDRGPIGLGDIPKPSAFGQTIKYSYQGVAGETLVISPDHSCGSNPMYDLDVRQGNTSLPVTAEPITGRETVTLPADGTYTVAVNAWVPLQNSNWSILSLPAIFFTSLYLGSPPSITHP